MSYVLDDARGLASGGAGARGGEWIELPPPDAPVGAMATARGTNAAIVWAEAAEGQDFVAETVDEYVILAVGRFAPFVVESGDTRLEVAEEAVVIVPPGHSVVRTTGDGPVVRVFTAHEADVIADAVNAAAYVVRDPVVAPLESWPAPVDGSRLREYRLSDHPPAEGIFGRIFRTRELMINVLPNEPAPRDPATLSPHHHDDFEQLSLAIEGRYVHHLRYPWGPDSRAWREDQHGEIGTPSLCVIPPPAIHTSQGIGPRQQLVDIFAPPRVDFSAKPGWVRNESEYPRP